MSCFRKLCGKKNKEKDPPVDRIIQKLEHTEELLLKQQEKLEKQIEGCMTAAKINATTNKRMSMRALQKKKRLEKNLEQVDYTLTTLELQKDALENAKTNAEILGSMESAGKALKKAHVKLDSNKVQKLMDDISEQHDVGNEISTTLRKSLVINTDEDELAKEFEELQYELTKQKNKDSLATKFPSIPESLDIVFPDLKRQITTISS